MQRITLDSEISYVITEKELKEIRADERAKAIEFVVDKIIFPLLNEYDIKLWEDIDYIELAEKWVEFVNARKGENDDIANDLKNWIAEQLKGGAENDN